MEKRKRGNKNPSITGIHLGKMVAEKIKEQRISKAELARRMSGRPDSAISPLLKRPSMQAYLLWELSIALKYDFFEPLSEALSRQAAAQGAQMVSGKAGAQAAMAALENEASALRSENNYLKKMIDVMAK